MKRSLSRGEKRLIGVCGVVMLGLVGLGWIRAGLEAEPDWGIPAATPTPQPNGVDLYIAAKMAIIPANPPVDQVNNPTLVTDPKVIATQYSLTRRTAWLKQNARAWALFEQAKAADSRHFQNRKPLSVPFSGYAGLRELARCKVIEVNTAKMRGDWNEATKNGLDIIEMGGDIERGGPLMAFLVGVAIQAIGENSFRDTPAHLNAQQARAAARRLEKLIASNPSLVDALREDKWQGLVQLREVMRTSNWRLPSAWGIKAPLKDTLGSLFLSKRQTVESYVRGADWNIAQAQQPYSPSPPPAPDGGTPINRIMNPNFARSKFNEARADTQLSLLLLRFALRAYRVEKAKYPASLNELVPEYLTKVPLDPFGRGTPIHYKKTGDSYLLWSIGPDGKDDQGKPTPPLGQRKIAMIAPDNVGDAIAIPEWK